MTSDLHVLNLFTSRLCHDLISPISAINNGLELLDDMKDDPEIAEEALELVKSSAEYVAALLSVIRLAYGGENAAVDQPDKIFELIQIYMRKVKITVSRLLSNDDLWPEFLKNKNAPKIFVMGSLLAEQSLPYGGTLEVSAAPLDEHTFQLTLRGEGRLAQFKPESLEALDAKLPPSNLTSRSVSDYIIGRSVEALGWTIHINQTPPHMLRIDARPSTR